MSTSTPPPGSSQSGDPVTEPEPFDFRRPSTLPREQVRIVEIVQEALARGFTTALAASLRAVTQVSMGDLEQCTYDEYVRSIPNPALLTMLSLTSPGMPAMLEIPLPVGFAATELLLGGAGGTKQPDRPMTELELTMMRSIIDVLLPEIKTAFEPITSTEPSIIGQESNPQFAQMASPSEMVVVMSLDVVLESAVGVMRLCVPFGDLHPHLESRATGVPAGARAVGSGAPEQARLRQQIASAPVEATATFVPATATSRQIVSLQVGDVLVLPHPTSVPLCVLVDNVELFDATIGRVNRQMALEIYDTAPEGRHRRAGKVRIVTSA